MARISAASLQSLFSTLLRLITYAYLRIIPAPQGRTVIPSLFAAYFLAWTVDLISPSAQISTSVKVVVEEDEKVVIRPSTNGGDSKVDVTTTSTINATTVPTTKRTGINTLLFSLPTASTPAKLFSLLINLALFGMVLDFLYRPTFTTHDDLTFTRVGAVYHDSAKIVVRYPGVEDGVRIVYRQLSGTPTGTSPELDNESGWTDGPLLFLTPDQDWISVAKVDSLWTSTKYQYRLAAANATLLPYPKVPIEFKTFPDPRIPGTKFKFIASSCILPNFPYVPFLPTTRIKGFELLAQQLEADSPSLVASNVHTPEETKAVAPEPTSDPITPQEADAPAGPTSDPVALVSDTIESATAVLPEAVPTQDPLVPTVIPTPVETDFMILLGDFIYADVPRSPADDKDAFLAAYREVYASEDFRKIYERLPTLSIYDDHEIKNDFNGYSNESIPIWANASHAWAAYQGRANYDGQQVDANGHQPYYFDFMHGDVAFFVLDTRRYRSVVGVNTTEGDVPTLLGDKQMSDFRKWVGKVNSTAAFKFVVSSVPLTGMWGGLNGQVDTWMGAPEERRAFIELLEYVPNVVVISGDRHEFAAVEHLGANSIHEFSISPLSQFYIPYARTFWSSNAPKRSIVTTVNITTEDGVVETHEVTEHEETEKMLKYLPHGNYKWGTFEVDTTNADEPTVKLELTIDGAKAWEYTIVGKPVHWAGSTSLNPSAIAESVTEGVKNVLSKLGRIFG